MSIQIKGINTELLLYKTQLEKTVPFSEKMVRKFHRVVEKANNLPESENIVTKARGAMLEAKAVSYGMAALAADRAEMNIRKKQLMSATGFGLDEVAIDINELGYLRNKRKNVKVFGDSIRYSAQIRPEWLSTIETIFGDADLQALKDFNCLSSLKAIYGDLNLSQVKDAKVDLSGMNLQMVYGDIHAERAISTNGLEDLLFVGGVIYYQDQSYTLEEFQNVFGSSAKERQM